MSFHSIHSVLSDKAILRYIEHGEVIIEPFNPRNLNTSSYDVTLGPYFFREQDSSHDQVSNIYNMYSETDVKKVWGEPQQAKPYSFYKEKGITLENISDNNNLIFINPGESILAHTNEFIGGTTRVTTMMKARSSTGRNFIETAKCAGWGDVGYYNRWTMEITNNSTKYRIPLVVGRRIAQIIFFDTEGTIGEQYNKVGKYQSTNDVTELVQKWSPYDMLPKMYKDFDIQQNQ